MASGNDLRKRAAGSVKKKADASKGSASSGKSKAKNCVKDCTSMLPGCGTVVIAVGILAALFCIRELRLFHFSSEGNPGHRKGGGGGRTGHQMPSSGKKSSAQRMLTLTLRLSEMATVASTLAVEGGLDSIVAKELDTELSAIEAEVAEAPVSTSTRDLLAMVSVVRGTLYQQSGAAADAGTTGRSAEKTAFTYDDPKYWDGYYKMTGDAESYDWYGGWQTEIEAQEVTSSGGAAGMWSRTELGDLMRPYLTRQSKILMLGCGNSELSERMYQAGFQEIVNVDISYKLLESLRARLADRMPKMQWVFGNASALHFANHSFDVIVEKGTLDALEPNPQLLQAAIRESLRTLQPGGAFLSISHNGAPKRVELQLQGLGRWEACKSFSYRKVGGPKGADPGGFFLHACRSLGQ